MSRSKVRKYVGEERTLTVSLFSTQPQLPKIMHPSTHSLWMWRTSAHRSAMMGLCSGDPLLDREIFQCKHTGDSAEFKVYIELMFMKKW
ncbi:hypothetical protein CEXT_89761 [Caerostris extrusa]|uniref:Uncharacterized protein n=1 Tax=Caerostris extrusa TaxID=172846 RepID=A0AAV4Y9H2_CAEEX|nr:hypothetical protein CEXT_89761 [Caerostris extrusa]